MRDKRELLKKIAAVKKNDSLLKQLIDYLKGLKK
jgi:hypothetical protein